MSTGLAICRRGQEPLELRQGARPRPRQLELRPLQLISGHDGGPSCVGQNRDARPLGRAGRRKCPTGVQHLLEYPATAAPRSGGTQPQRPDRSRPVRLYATWPPGARRPTNPLWWQQRLSAMQATARSSGTPGRPSPLPGTARRRACSHREGANPAHRFRPSPPGCRGHHAREAPPLRLRPIEECSAGRARVRDQGDLAGGQLQGRQEGCVQPGIRVDETDAVGSSNCGSRTPGPRRGGRSSAALQPPSREIPLNSTTTARTPIRPHWRTTSGRGAPQAE